MLTTNVASFLRRARVDSELAEHVRTVDSYEALAELSVQAGQAASACELRETFAARNARVLLQQMMRRGVIDPVPMAPVQPIDQSLWNRITTMDLNPVATQLVNRQGWTASRDCKRAVGRFVHHTFLSPDDPAEARELTAVWLVTRACYESLFEEPYEETIGAALLDRWPKV
jgi:hypothetical protein